MDNNSSNLPDATKFKLIDNLAPAWSLPYIQLSRIDRPIGSWLLFIPCLWGLCLGILESDSKLGFYDIWMAVGCGLGAILMRGAGCTWNDINDWKIDAKVRRTKLRPIPSGQVTIKNALRWMFLQCLLAFFILLSFPKPSIILGIASLLPIAIYPFAKRFTWWPQIFLGIAFNWGILLGFSSQGIGITINCIFLYIAAISWTLFYDTIYAFQDIEDDSLIGVKSTARFFKRNATYWLLSFIAVFFIFTSIAFYNSIFHNSKEIFLICSSGLLLFCASLLYQLSQLNINSPSVCLTLFRSNKISGLLLCFFLATSLLF